jgi:hypothetical protein
MTEATTAATDFLLGAITLYLAVRLLAASRQRGARSRLWWGVALAMAGVAALTGGAYHAIAGNVSALTLAILWKATLFSISAAAFALVPATAIAFLSKTWHRPAMYAAGATSIAFAAAALFTDDFLLAVCDYGISLLFVLTVTAALRRQQRIAARWILAGVSISVLAAVIQQSGYALHPRFNHNDLYHVVQIAANFTFYRGASRSRDAGDPAAAVSPLT